jgi:hypothetical protein
MGTSSSLGYRPSRDEIARRTAVMTPEWLYAGEKSSDVRGARRRDQGGRGRISGAMFLGARVVSMSLSMFA